MRTFVKFITYNNTVPIVLGILFLSSGLAFAANDEVREIVSDSFFEAEQRVVSVDNSYIANKDLLTFSPKVQIKNVTEDDNSYYVEYSFTTIGLANQVWQDVADDRVMEVTKTALGDYQDLGVYVTEQLKQLVEREVAYLQEVQEIERRQVTSKTVATAYSGLVGQFLDEKTETLPGYVPRVVEPVVTDPDPVEVAKAEKSDVIVVSVPTQTSNNSNQEQQATSGPVISILGANPARITIGSSYSDLGAVTTSAEGVTLDLSLKLTLNGAEVNAISIDTTEAADWSVGYTAVDQDGNTSFAERVVIVYDPNAVEEEEIATTTATTTESTTATSTEQTQAEEGEEETATTTAEVVEENSEPVVEDDVSEEDLSEEEGSDSTATTTDAT